MKKIICCLTVLCVAAITVIILMCTGIIKCNCTKDTKELKVEESKLTEIKDGDYKATKVESTHMNSYALLLNGKVVIDFEREITNVSNAVDIVLLNEYLYILTEDGNVYKYFTGITKEAILDATKVDTVKDVKKIVKYTVRKQAAGGCDYVVAIDANNNYTSLEDFCV